MTEPGWNASLYEAGHSFVWRLVDDLIELLAPQPGERILDLGSGTGHLTAKLAESGAEVVGLDASREMVEQARANYPRLTFVIADAAAFSFTEPFDAVFSNAVLHWVRRPEDAVRCIAGCLRSGGRLVAELGGRGNIAFTVASIEAARAAWGLPSRPELNPWYNPGLGEYTSMLERHGLEVTFAHLFDRPTPFEPGEGAFRAWMRMFGMTFLADMPEREHEAFILDVERRVRARLYQNGQWVGDYRRLRVVATKD